MSDYMFMLESHLNADQAKALNQVREAAEAAGVNLFLTGGAMRDMMAGFPIRDLDFTVENLPAKTPESLLQQSGASLTGNDELRKSAEGRFPSGTIISISLAKREKFSKPGSKPQVEVATIHEDLRCRDFTVNAIALSMGKASRGLLLDPTNGLGDIDRKELRTVSNYTLYDDPSRILRMFRLKYRLGYTIEERTLNQYRNLRKAELEKKISPAAWSFELQQISQDPLVGDILKELDQQHLITSFLPFLTSAKLNLALFEKLQKARLAIPFGVRLDVNWSALFLHFLTEKLTPREKSQVVAALQFEGAETIGRLEAKASKAEKEIAAARITRPSALYSLVSAVPGEIIMLLLARSAQRLAVDRLKNYLHKYLSLAQEITDEEVMASSGLEPRSPKFAKAKTLAIATKLDARPKKIPEPEEVPLPVPVLPRRTATGTR